MSLTEMEGWAHELTHPWGLTIGSGHARGGKFSDESMQDAPVIHALDIACGTPGLVFQVTEEGGQLSIVINYPQTVQPDYELWKVAVKSAIATHVDATCRGFWLSSRVLGQVEPNWQAYVPVKPLRQTQSPSSEAAPSTQDDPSAPMHTVVTIGPQTTSPLQIEPQAQAVQAATCTATTVDSFRREQEQPTDEPAADRLIQEQHTTSRPEAKAIDVAPADQPAVTDPADEEGQQESPALATYCFIRNQALLKSEILPPSQAVARLICAFDQLSAQAQQTLLPELEPFFKATSNRPYTVNSGHFTDDEQAWFEQLTQLKAADLRKAAIWMSRYCHNPKTAIADLQVVVNPQAVAAQQATQVDAADAAVPDPQVTIEPDLPSRATVLERKRQITKRAEKRKFAAQRRYLLLMAAWMILIFAVVVMRARSPMDAGAIAKLCSDSSASQDACQLTAQLVGEPMLEASQTEDEAFPPGLLQRGRSMCEYSATVNAGKPLGNIFEESSEVLSSSGEEIFPGLYLARVEQENFKAGEPDDPAPGEDRIQTACVFSYSGVDSFEPIATEVIPLGWPETPYVATSWAAKWQRAAHAYNQFVQFGANTLFTAVGLFLAALMGLAIRFQTMNGIILSAFLLQIVETVLALLLPFGIGLFQIFFNISRMSVAMLITSACVKQFEIDWSSGFRLVGFGAFVIMLVRGLLHLGLFGLIAYLV